MDQGFFKIIILFASCNFFQNSQQVSLEYNTATLDSRFPSGYKYSNNPQTATPLAKPSAEPVPGWSRPAVPGISRRVPGLARVRCINWSTSYLFEEIYVTENFVSKFNI